MQGPQFASHRVHQSVRLANLSPAGAKVDSPEGPNPAEADGSLHGSPLRERRKSNPNGAPSEDDIGHVGELERRTRWKSIKAKAIRHLAFAGPGIVCAVAYIDPGNWSTDLSAGSQFGYSHLFVVLLSGLMALLFQILSARLGCVSDLDLASHCRVALNNRPRHRMLGKAALWFLWAMAEGGIIMTDLAELLGSAIAINLLIPKIPLWAAVLITASDVLLVLMLFSEYPSKFVTRSMRLFEAFIGVLVLIVLGSFVALLAKVNPDWRDVFHGYVPGPRIVSNGALYTAVGIIGATVMPHAFFIGSKMATMRRLSPASYGEDEDEDDKAGSVDHFETQPPPGQQPASHRRQLSMANAGPSLHLPQPFSIAGFNLGSRLGRTRSAAEVGGDGQQAGGAGGGAEKASDEMPPKPTLACVRAHLSHSVADIAGSLLGFALLINSAILILAAAVFYYGDGQTAAPDGVSDLFDAFDLVEQYIGRAFALLFAIGLLASGQAASLTVTLSGQIVGEGFIAWRTVPWKRRLVTRLIGIVPSLAVSVAVGRSGIDDLLVGSQVALSIVLTFVTIPLIVFTSQHSVMAIPISPKSPSSPATPPALTPPSEPWTAKRVLKVANPFRRRIPPPGTVSYANQPYVIWLCGALWLLIGAANVVALIDLGKGQT